MIFGVKDDCIFVNSAQSISVDNVEDFFSSGWRDGSVPLEEFHEAISQDNEQIKIGDLVVGRVAIRKLVEAKGKEFRGKPYTKRQANNLIGSADFIRSLKNEQGVLINYSDVSSVHTFVEKKHKEGQEKHINSLQKARKVLPS